jgi:3-hydroxyisobutyrate dehydrogenase-like beta-hydroxyacid dehydrogenase
MKPSIGLIGIGNLGRPIAENLLAAGYPLRVYSRRPEQAQPLVERGATQVDRAVDVVEKGGILVTVLPDDAAVETVADDAMADALGAGGLHLSLSTILPTTSAKLAAHHTARSGATYLAGPVFGRPEAAAARKLWIAVSGPPAAKTRAKPIFDAIGQGVFDFGDAPGAANVVKLMGNFLINAAIEAMGEASAVAESHGIPRADFLGMLTQTLFACPIYQNYAKKIVSADFDQAGFTVKLTQKDVRLMQETARAANATLPIADVLKTRLDGTIARGRGNLDATAFVLESAEGAGLRWYTKA